MTNRTAGFLGKNGAVARNGAPGRSPGDAAARSAEAELPARLRIAVTRLNRRLRQESVTGVSPSQESALSTINRLGDPTLGELAQAEQVQPPTMTRIIGTMEAAGLVARRGDQGDRRVSRVELTAEGRVTLERIKNLKNAYLARQIANVTRAERAQAVKLAALLERLVEEQ